MFSSLASFFFGANTDNPNSVEREQGEQQQLQLRQQQQEQQQQQGEDLSGDVIEVTPTTPTVTGGAISKRRAGKRGKQRRKAANQRKNPPTIAKLLTPNGENCEEDIDENEWFIVEKEEEDEQSLPRSDSEEEISVPELQQQRPAVVGVQAARRRQQPPPHINSHSLYCGPRPQQQRNYLQRSRHGTRSVNGAFNYSTLSATGGVPNGDVARSNANVCSVLADNGLMQPLYAVPLASPCGSNSSDHESNAHGSGVNMSMEESWYVTPPPCFTSIGPVNMETSPFENLLIEHPSMSVYHSIRSAQEATDSYINFDLGVNEPQQPEPQPQAQPQSQPQAQINHQAKPLVARKNRANNSNSIEQAANNSRIDRQASVQLKQQTLARKAQKSNNKKKQQQLMRGALNRANKVREMQGSSKRTRRSDRQHCRLNSGANNNRKCCY